MKKILVLLTSLIALFVINIDSNAKSSSDDMYTRYTMHKMIKDTSNKNYQVPKFNKTKIKDLPSAVDENGEKINVWDSWPLQNPDGSVTNFKGYNVVFAMGGKSKLYIFYKKANQKVKNVSDWKFAGRVFKDNDTFSDGKNVETQKDSQEWSGSASSIKGSKDYVQLFYTNVRWDKTYNKQLLSTAKINLKTNKNGLYVDHNKMKNNKSIFAGDGYYYQTPKMSNSNSYMNPTSNDVVDDFCMRDPHYVENNGKKYLLFDGNTGNYRYQGYKNIFNDKYFGGTKESRNRDRVDITGSKHLIDSTQYANGAIGILELNNNYSVKKVMKPLMTFNNVNDEVERPNLFKYKGRWYLFTLTHGWHFASNATKNSMDSYLLGFSSKNFDKGFKPLNKNGLVLYNGMDSTRRDYSYSYYPVKTKKGIIVTSFAGDFGGDPNGKFKQTFAPSYTLKVNGNKTSTKNSKILPQGALEIK